MALLMRASGLEQQEHHKTIGLAQPVIQGETSQTLTSFFVSLVPRASMSINTCTFEILSERY